MVTSCPQCRSLVEARQRLFCDWDPYACSQCGLELRPAQELTCPACEGPLSWQTGMASLRAHQPEGRVHFLRIGREGKKVLAGVRGFRFWLKGASQDGFWVGEGMVQGRSLKFSRWLQDWDCGQLEICLPGGRPWMRPDLERLRQGLEGQALLFDPIFKGWLSQAILSNFFTALVNAPPGVNCLKAVHDGHDWQPLSQSELRLHYRNGFSHILNQPGQPTCAYPNESPRRIELLRQGELLARWLQSDFRGC
ncbi:MAG: hypothetical protein U0931_27175 [Vulcanimicrobiota bacterium]